MTIVSPSDSYLLNDFVATDFKNDSIDPVIVVILVGNGLESSNHKAIYYFRDYINSAELAQMTYSLDAPQSIDKRHFLETILMIFLPRLIG